MAEQNRKIERKSIDRSKGRKKEDRCIQNCFIENKDKNLQVPGTVGNRQ